MATLGKFFHSIKMISLLLYLREFNMLVSCFFFCFLENGCSIGELCAEF